MNTVSLLPARSLRTAAAAALVAGHGLVLADRARLRRQLAAARRDAGRDALTGLMSRRAAARHFAERRRRGRATTVVLLDLDGFKAVNDEHGHLAGDALLTAVGTRLREQVRPLAGAAARLGGDEFLLLLPARPPAEHRHQVRSILDTLAEPVPVVGGRGPVRLSPSASAGIASGLRQELDWNGLLGAADVAMYRAKAAGVRGGRCCLADDEAA
jgi:diguanylate cyclase (GGDEF)-like protein